MLLQDVRYALRSLGRSPGFTIVALLTLALGIGGTTAIFSVVDSILLRPLPFPQPSSVVSIGRSGRLGRESSSFSAADYLDYKRSARSFAALAGYRGEVIDLTGRGEPIRLNALETTAGFFDAIRMPALRGRAYSEAADSPKGPRLAVLSEGVWRQHLGSDEQVVGNTIRLNGIPTTVVGVMPRALVHPLAADIWMLAPNEIPTSPLPIENNALADREVQYFQALGRLKPDVSLQQAIDDLRTIDSRLARELPETNDGEFATIEGLQESLVGDLRNALLVLFGAVAFVLLIACANVASLLLARGSSRRREFAVRTALGAGRARLVRQLLTESLVLASAGGVLGLVVAYWGVEVLIALAPESIPRIADVRLDPRVTAFAIAASACVGVLFGVIPAFHAARHDVTNALKDGGRTGTSRTAAQKVLVVAEVALALVLLIGAGLMLTSFARLRAVDPGFTVTNLVVVGVPLPQARYNADAQIRFYSQLYERLRENPVTTRAALGFPTPFGGANASGSYTIEGAAPQARSERPVAQLGSATPDYFRTMGIPLLRGRDFALTDTQDRPAVAIVNQTMAEREWPDIDPVGRRITIGGDPADADSWHTVVGVVGNSKRTGLDTSNEPAIYLPHSRLVLPYMSVFVRSEADVATVASAVKSAVRTLDMELPVEEAHAFEESVAQATGQPRFRAVLVGAFAAAALLLAAVGLYGLISYTVAQRIPELGVRLALGATPLQIGRLILGQGLVLAAAGVALGIAGALAATRLLEGLLFSVSATDPTVYAALALLLLTIAAVACYVPARRAMRVDPITALRAE